MKPREQRHCKHHGMTEFVAQGSDNHWRCVKCRNERVSEHRRKIKERAVEYKGGACQECGYSACHAALEFHHLDPAEKDFHLARAGHSRSWERVRAELDKCVMLCSNCHKEVHAGIRIVRV